MPENPDPLTYTIKLQPGVKFQNVDPTNGREFVAEDVKYSLERQLTDQAGKFQLAYFFLGALDKIDAHLAAWRPLVKPEDLPAFEKVVPRTAEFRAAATPQLRSWRIKWMRGSLSLARISGCSTPAGSEPSSISRM